MSTNKDFFLLYRKSVWLLLCCVSVFETVAQDSTKLRRDRAGLRFSSINQVGFLNGERGADLQLQSVNGVRYQSWFAGVGIGLDFYGTRGIPLFLDIRRSINMGSKLPLVPFIYADGGIHFPWALDNDKELGYDNKFRNGLYMDVGLGCEVKLKKQQAVLFSLGYSRKEVQQRLIPIEEDRDTQYSPITYDYNYNRLSIKIGWQL